MNKILKIQIHLQTEKSLFKYNNNQKRREINMKKKLNINKYNNINKYVIFLKIIWY